MVTIHVVSNLKLASKQKLSLSMRPMFCSLFQKTSDYYILIHIYNLFSRGGVDNYKRRHDPCVLNLSSPETRAVPAQVQWPLQPGPKPGR